MSSPELSPLSYTIEFINTALLATIVDNPWLNAKIEFSILNEADDETSIAAAPLVCDVLAINLDLLILKFWFDSKRTYTAPGELPSLEFSMKSQFDIFNETKCAMCYETIMNEDLHEVTFYKCNTCNIKLCS